MKRSLFCCVIAIVTCAASASIASADLYIDTGANANLQAWSLGDYTVGSRFTVSGAPIPVNQLGYIDVEGNGLEVSHRVGLWRESDQALLASVEVTPTSSTEASAHGTAVWYMENIGTPIMLGPGAYRVGGHIGNGDRFAYSNDKIGNGVSISSGYVRTSFPGGFNYPNLSFSSNGIRVTVGFSQAVPEPGALGMLVGLVGVAFVRRRR